MFETGVHISGVVRNKIYNQTRCWFGTHERSILRFSSIILQVCRLGVLYTASRTIFNAGVSVTET